MAARTRYQASTRGRLFLDQGGLGFLNIRTRQTVPEEPGGMTGPEFIGQIQAIGIIKCKDDNGTDAVRGKGRFVLPGLRGALALVRQDLDARRFRPG